MIEYLSLRKYSVKTSMHWVNRVYSDRPGFVLSQVRILTRLNNFYQGEILTQLQSVIKIRLTKVSEEELDSDLNETTYHNLLLYSSHLFFTYSSHVNYLAE